MRLFKAFKLLLITELVDVAKLCRLSLSFLTDYYTELSKVFCISFELGVLNLLFTRAAILSLDD